MLTVGLLPRSRPLWVILAGFLVLAIFLSWLQVWSRSGADAVEVWGRPLFVALCAGLLLRGVLWARWLLAISGVAYALWFARSATTPNALTDWRWALLAAAVAEVGLVIALFALTLRHQAMVQRVGSRSDGA